MDRAGIKHAYLVCNKPIYLAYYFKVNECSSSVISIMHHKVMT